MVYCPFPSLGLEWKEIDWPSHTQGHCYNSKEEYPESFRLIKGVCIKKGIPPLLLCLLYGNFGFGIASPIKCLSALTPMHAKMLEIYPTPLGKCLDRRGLWTKTTTFPINHFALKSIWRISMCELWGKIEFSFADFSHSFSTWWVA